jgi:hypothetical protein
MSFEITDRVAPGTVARTTGGLYLAFMVTSVLADALGHIGLGDAQQIYRSITTDLMSFRIGLMVALVSGFLFLMAAWGLFVLLRPVNRELALLFLLLNAVGVAVQCASLLQLVPAMLIGSGQPIPPATSAEASALIAITTYRVGFVTAQLFYGTWLFPLGYLVWKSRFLPRFLGVLLLLDGVGEMVWVVQGLVLPAYPGIKVPGTAVSLVAEVGLALWLVIRGVKAATPTKDRVVEGTLR